MKNLMIYVSPRKAFIESDRDNEISLLPKIQIDNSLELGWKKEDILLVTNFEYEHNGVKALVVDDDLFCESSPTATKIFVMKKLIEDGVIGDEIVWFHDLDAFQLEWFDEPDLDGKDLGITEYGKTNINDKHDKRLSTGIMFFNKNILDILEWIIIKNRQYGCNEEVALLDLTKKEKYGLDKRIKILNLTYNLATRRRNLVECYKVIDKPLKVLHFHPFDKRKVVFEEGDNIDVCVYGNNRLNKVLITDRLIKLFNKYGIINSHTI